MKILALMTEPYHGFGGIAQYGRDLVDALARNDRIATVLSLPRLRADRDEGLPAKLREHSPSSSPIGYTLHAIGLGLRFRPDLILCGHVNLLPVAAAVKVLTGAPLVLMGHGFEIWQPVSWLRRAVLERADLVLAVSRYTRRRFLEWARLDPRRVRILPNAIRLDRYGPRGKPPHLVDRYGVEGNRVLLSVGRLDRSERYKGHDRIISVLAEVLERHPDTVYLIVGGGDDLARLGDLAQSCGVRSRVIFAGRVADEELTDHYHLADAFALPSTGEGFGFVFLEAVACGLPTLGGSRDGSADALADGEFGVLVDPDDPAALVRGLGEILSSPKRVPPGISRFGFERFEAALIEHVSSMVDHRDTGRVPT